MASKTPPPRITGFSDCQTRLLIWSFYGVVVCATIATMIGEDDIVRTNDIHAKRDSFWNYTYRVQVNNAAPYVGLSFKNDRPYESFLPLELNIGGFQCGDSQAEESLYRGNLSQAPSRRIALITPVRCREYVVSFSGASLRATSDATLPDLYAESQHGDWPLISFWVRVILAVLYSSLTVALWFSWNRARRTSGAPLGSGSCMVASLAIVCLSDPVDIVACYVFPRWRWLPLRLIGANLMLFYPCLFVSEVITDLHQQGVPKIIFPRSWTVWLCEVSTSRRYQSAVSRLQTFYLVYLIFVAILLATFCRVVVREDRNSIDLATSWETTLGRIHQHRFFLLDLPKANLFIYIFALRLIELMLTLERFPYSKCRVHAITASWMLLCCVALQVLGILFLMDAFETWHLARRDPWYALNKEVLSLVLPGVINLKLDSYIVPGLFTILLAFAFWPYTVVQSAAETHPQLDLTCHRISDASSSSNSVPTHEASLNYSVNVTRSNLGSTNLGYMSSLPRLNSALLEGPRSSTYHHQLSVPGSYLAPPGENTTFQSSCCSMLIRSMQSEPMDYEVTIPMTTGNLCASAWLNPMHGGRQEEPEDSVTLSTVRLLAHCCHAVYNDDITSRSLKQTDLPEHEKDLKLESLELHEVIHEPRVDVRAIVAKDVEAPNIASLAEELHIKGVRVHRGFQEAMLAMRDDLLRQISELDCEMVWVTGHSMGGALATLVAVELHLTLKQAKKNAAVSLCTFGCPRVGNAAFTEVFKFSACRSIRVVHDTDPIPSFLSAFRLCLHYDHVSGLVRVFGHGHLVYRPSYLEEVVPWLLLHAFLPRLLCWCPLFLWRGQDHLVSNYIAALWTAQQLESCSADKLDEFGITTSFRPSALGSNSLELPAFASFELGAVN